MRVRTVFMLVALGEMLFKGFVLILLLRIAYPIFYQNMGEADVYFVISGATIAIFLASLKLALYEQGVKDAI